MNERDILDGTSAYEQEVQRTVTPDLDHQERLLLGALGLAGETGEVVDLIKKHRFTAWRVSEHADMLLELGDVLWYLTLLASCYGWSLQQVMRANIHKLRQRYPVGGQVE